MREVILIYRALIICSCCWRMAQNFMKVYSSRTFSTNSTRCLLISSRITYIFTFSASSSLINILQNAGQISSCITSLQQSDVQSKLHATFRRQKVPELHRQNRQHLHRLMDRQLDLGQNRQGHRIRYYLRTHCDALRQLPYRRRDVRAFLQAHRPHRFPRQHPERSLQQQCGHHIGILAHQQADRTAGNSSAYLMIISQLIRNKYHSFQICSRVLFSALGQNRKAMIPARIMMTLTTMQWSNHIPTTPPVIDTMNITLSMIVLEAVGNTYEAMRLADDPAGDAKMNITHIITSFVMRSSTEQLNSKRTPVVESRLGGGTCDQQKDPSSDFVEELTHRARANEAYDRYRHHVGANLGLLQVVFGGQSVRVLIVDHVEENSLSEDKYETNYEFLGVLGETIPDQPYYLHEISTEGMIVDLNLIMHVSPLAVQLVRLDLLQQKPLP